MAGAPEDRPLRRWRHGSDRPPHGAVPPPSPHPGGPALSVAFGCVDVAGYELVAYTSGLSAGLTKALADLDDVDLMAAAHAGWAAVPAQRVHEGASVLEHHMATSEGVAILDVRLPAGLVPLRPAGDRPEVVGLRLAAVRIGLARKLLDLAIGALTGGRPPLHH